MAGTQTGYVRNPGVVLGRARVGLFVGLGAIVLGFTFQVALASWVGVALVGLAFAANVVAKVAHFRELPLSPTERTRLAGLWLFFALALVALVADVVAGQTVPDYVGAFWPLLLVVVVLGGAYRYAQSRYLDEEMVETGPS